MKNHLTPVIMSYFQPRFGWRGQQPKENYEVPLSGGGLQKQDDCWVLSDEVLVQAGQKIGQEPGFVLFPDVAQALQACIPQKLGQERLLKLANQFQVSAMEQLAGFLQKHFPQALIPLGFADEPGGLPADVSGDVSATSGVDGMASLYDLHRDDPKMAIVSMRYGPTRFIQAGTGLPMLLDGNALKQSLQAEGVNAEAAIQETTQIQLVLNHIRQHDLATVLPCSLEAALPMVFFDNQRIFHGATPPQVGISPGSMDEKKPKRPLYHVSWRADARNHSE